MASGPRRKKITIIKDGVRHEIWVELKVIPRLRLKIGDYKFLNFHGFLQNYN